MSEPGKLAEQEMEFKYGRSIIGYRLIYEDRKNLAITVNPNKMVVIRAPAGSSQEEIQAKLLKRGQWIIKQLNYFDKYHPLQPERQYLSGETHYYLGRQYRMRIREGKENSVKLIGQFFRIIHASQSENRELIKSILLEWYAIHAQSLLDRRIKLYLELIFGSGYKPLEVQYRRMKSRWGSYSKNGVISF